MARKNHLVQAFLAIHKREPEKGMPDYKIAMRIIEVFGDENFVSNDLARECVYSIVHGGVHYPNKKIKHRVIRATEDIAPRVFHELQNIDEVHMDQIEVAYHRWKRTYNQNVKIHCLN